jgi:hypothetical protein
VSAAVSIVVIVSIALVSIAVVESTTAVSVTTESIGAVVSDGVVLVSSRAADESGSSVSGPGSLPLQPRRRRTRGREALIGFTR